MRITPLAVWCRNLSDSDIFRLVEEDTHLTHSNKEAIEAC
jgi:ADP-ribosylglycohydrolase